MGCTNQIPSLTTVNNYSVQLYTSLYTVCFLHPQQKGSVETGGLAREDPRWSRITRVVAQWRREKMFCVHCAVAHACQIKVDGWPCSWSEVCRTLPLVIGFSNVSSLWKDSEKVSKRIVSECSAMILYVSSCSCSLCKLSNLFFYHKYLSEAKLYLFFNKKRGGAYRTEFKEFMVRSKVIFLLSSLFYPNNFYHAHTADEINSYLNFW